MVRGAERLPERLAAKLSMEKLKTQKRREATTTPSVRFMPGIVRLRARFNRNRLVVLIGDRQRLSPIRVTQSSPTIIARTLRNARSNRKAGLQLVHPRLHFMSVNLLPDIRRPVLVKLAWIFDEENVIGVNLKIAALKRTDRNRIGLALERKARHHLLDPRSQRRNIGHHILNRELLQGRQQSRLVLEIRPVPLPIIGIVSKLITDLHPYRLLGQLARRRQIIGMQLLRRNVVVRLQRRFRLGLRLFLHSRAPLVHDVSRPPARNHKGGPPKDLELFSSRAPLVHDVIRPPARNHKGGHQKDLQFFPKLRAEGHYLRTFVWGRAPRPSKPSEARQLPALTITLDPL